VIEKVFGPKKNKMGILCYNVKRNFVPALISNCCYSSEILVVGQRFTSFPKM